MSELVVRVPQAHHSWTRVAVATALVFAAIAVTIALSWPTGGQSKRVNGFDIPQSVITQASQEKAAWDRLGKLIDEQQSRLTCSEGRPC